MQIHVWTAFLKRNVSKFAHTLILMKFIQEIVLKKKKYLIKIEYFFYQLIFTLNEWNHSPKWSVKKHIFLNISKTRWHRKKFFFNKKFSYVQLQNSETKFKKNLFFSYNVSRIKNFLSISFKLKHKCSSHTTMYDVLFITMKIKRQYRNKNPFKPFVVKFIHIYKLFTIYYDYFKDDYNFDLPTSIYIEKPWPLSH